MDKNNLAIPGSIILAGLLVAGALVFVNQQNAATAKTAAVADATAGQDITISPVTEADHIRGNPNAPVVIVEFSDTECPYCKQFHTTLQRIYSEYGGGNGKVAWVYRHFPIAQLHSKAPHEAEATECAGELGGNDAFWAYLDKIFAITPANNGLDPAELPNIAVSLGLNREAFLTCLNSGKYTKKVADQYAEAVRAQGQGTPYSIVLAKGKTIPIPGAQPYDAVKTFIDTLLK